MKRVIFALLSATIANPPILEGRKPNGSLDLKDANRHLEILQICSFSRVQYGWVRNGRTQNDTYQTMENVKTSPGKYPYR